MGPGKQISSQKSKAPLSDSLPSIVELQAHPNSFSSIWERQENTAHASDTDATEDQAETYHTPSTLVGALFACPEEGCTTTFLGHSSLMEHLDSLQLHADLGVSLRNG